MQATDESTCPATRLSSDADEVIISVNPNAGSRSGRPQVEALEQLLKQNGLRVEVLSDLDAVATESRRAQREGNLRAVVAAGGDGTVAVIVNRTDPGIPITVLPLGTENLLSKHLGISADPTSVFETIRDGTVVKLDAGRAGDRIFLLMSGCGFDAEVVRRLHGQRTGHINHLSYAKPIIDSLRNYQYPPLRVYCEVAGKQEGEFEQQCIDAHFAFVVNLPRYAAGLSFAPDASGVDGLLDVCTFKQGSLLHGLRYLSGVVLGQHTSWDDCTITRTPHVRIESDAEVPYQLDGDPGGVSPVEMKVLPKRLTLVVPDAWAEQNGFVIQNQVEDGTNRAE